MASGYGDKHETPWEHKQFEPGAMTLETTVLREGKSGDGCGLLDPAPGPDFAHKLLIDLISAGPVQEPAIQVAPWAWLAKIVAHYDDGSQVVHTGWLAGPRLVVTNGRCAFDPIRGHARKARIVVGPRSRGLGRSWLLTDEVRMVNGWVETGKPECDYAAWILPEPGLPDVGYFGFAMLPRIRIVGEILNLSGYPGDKLEAAMWREGFRVSEANEFYIRRPGGFHAMPGGSPLWLYRLGASGAQRFVCGMVCSNDESGEALRIHQEFFNNIDKWRTETMGPQLPVLSGGEKKENPKESQHSLIADHTSGKQPPDQIIK